MQRPALLAIARLDVPEARADLVASGFGVVAGGQALSPVGTTAVFVPADSEISLSHGRDAARALGVAGSAVQVDPDADAVVDVRVVLGTDSAVAP